MLHILSAFLVASAVTAPVEAPLAVSAPVAVTESIKVPVVNFAGQIVERGTRAPIVDAEVQLPKLGLVEFSGPDGGFSFTDVPPGTHEVVVNAVGYKRFGSSEAISMDERTDAVYYLLADYTAIDEIVVEADKSHKEVSKTTLKREEIRKVPGVNNDAVKVVTVLPGVITRSEIDVEPLIRGSGAGENSFQIERVDVPYMFHFGGLRSVVSSDMLESVDFQAGGFSSLYGRATGGVIAANTRPGRTDRFGGAVDVNSLLAEGYVEGPLGEKGSVIAAARRSYFDATVAPIVKMNPDEDAQQFTVFPQFYDYQLRGDYRLTTDTTIDTFIFGTDDRMKIMMSRTDPREPDVTGSMYQHIFTHVQSLNLRRKYVGLATKTNFYHLTYGQTVLMAGRKANMVVNVFALNEDVSWKLGARHIINTGALLRFERWGLDLNVPRMPADGEKGYTFSDLPPISYRRTAALESGGLYLEDEIKLLPTWTLSPGLRFDLHNQEKTYAYLDPRLGTRWEASPSTTLKAALGRYSNFAPPETLDRKFGSPNLAPLHTQHYVAGVEHKLTRADTVDLQVYYKKFENFPFRYASGEYVRNTVKGEAYGAEILARHQLTGRLFGWVSYAYSRSTRLYPDIGKWAPADFDQPHVVNAVASYKLTDRWELGGKWRYSSGLLYTPVADRLYLADRSLYVPVDGERLSERYPASHRLDARLEYSYPFKAWILRTYVEVLNVYAAENASGYLSNYDYTQQQPVSFIAFPVPMLGVRGEF